jgi:hypothetical protein
MTKKETGKIEHSHTYNLYLDSSADEPTEEDRREAAKEMYITYGKEILETPGNNIIRALLPVDLTELEKEHQDFLAWCIERGKKNTFPKS